MRQSKFRNELESIINRNSMENGSNTPDFILAEYLADALALFDKATAAREQWYGREHVPGGGSPVRPQEKPNF